MTTPDLRSEVTYLAIRLQLRLIAFNDADKVLCIGLQLGKTRLLILRGQHGRNNQNMMSNRFINSYKPDVECPLPAAASLLIITNNRRAVSFYDIVGNALGSSSVTTCRSPRTSLRAPPGPLRWRSMSPQVRIRRN
jgi:hypothetical protein